MGSQLAEVLTFSAIDDVLTLSDNNRLFRFVPTLCILVQRVDHCFAKMSTNWSLNRCRECKTYFREPVPLPREFLQDPHQGRFSSTTDLPQLSRKTSGELRGLVDMQRR